MDKSGSARWVVFSALVLLCAASSKAQETAHFGDSVVVAAPLVYTLFVPDSLMVVGRRNETLADLNRQVEVIDGAQIARAQSLSTADALADLSGVYVQRSQFGGGSPVLRGFEANRVLLVVDGVRMNNAVYRGGHLHNAITVDPGSLDRIELLYGAGALAYGSDAIGGVVHFRTERPQYVNKTNKGAGTQGARNGRVAMTYASAAGAVTFGGKLGYGAADWAGLTALSSSFTSHLRAGARRPDRFPDFGRRTEYVARRNGVDRVVRNDDPDVQVGTAYKQFNLLQKFRFRLGDRVELTANFQYSTTSDVPRYDALTERRGGDLRWARWEYGPQTRTLAALTLNDRRATGLYDVATYLLSYQYVDEARITRLFGRSAEENNREKVRAANLQTDFSKVLSPFLTLRYGADLRFDAVTSTAFFKLPATGLRTPGLATRYPSRGSSLAAAGTYAEANFELTPNWKLRGGVRLSHQRLSATFGPDDPLEWPRAYLDGITNTESALTAGLGVRGRGVRLLYAQGFRAPNIDDFAKFRQRGGFVQVPNPDLRPERSRTLEAAYRLDERHCPGCRLSFELTAYHTWLNGAVVRRDGTLPDGSSVLESNGERLRVQTNANAESARIYGTDLVVSYAFAYGWNLTTDFHYLRGRREQEVLPGISETLPQDHIPPPYGSTRLRWNNDRWTVGLRLRYQLAKPPEDYAVGQVLVAGNERRYDRSGTSDNFERTPFDPATGTFAGSYGWWTANLTAEYAPNDRWVFRLKADNLLDKHYRTFASGVSAPGIDLGGGVSWYF